MVNILGANSVSGGYEIDNSLRFNNDDSPFLSLTPSSAGNRKTFTLSVWLKLQVGTTSERVLLAADDGTGGNNNFDYIAVKSGDKILVYGYEGSENQHLISTQVLRDPSAWYHLVVAFDTTQGTASNRIKFYLNGSQITAFDTANYPSQNFQTRINNANKQRISSYPDQGGSYFDGYMAEYHLVDGQQLTPSDFGEFNDNGVWTPKAYEGTYGTNGFYLEFKETGTGADASGIGADTSGNDNHWAVTNLAATDVTTDTPTNNFATFNPLARSVDNTYTEGNTVYDYSGNFMRCGVSTIGVFSGKWYAEFKRTDATTIHLFGIVADNFVSDGVTVSNNSANHNFGIEHTGTLFLKTTNSSQDIFLDGSDTNTNVDFTTTSNDIIMVAFDADSKKIWFGKNGTWSSSGDPAGGSNPSDTYDGTGSAPFFFSVGTENTQAIQGNFGNPAFAISSSNADGRGYGNFEYTVPSGFFSLCTKNLGEFG